MVFQCLRRAATEQKCGVESSCDLSSSAPRIALLLRFTSLKKKFVGSNGAIKVLISRKSVRANDDYCSSRECHWIIEPRHGEVVQDRTDGALPVKIEEDDGVPFFFCMDALFFPSVILFFLFTVLSGAVLEIYDSPFVLVLLPILYLHRRGPSRVPSINFDSIFFLVSALILY